MTYSESGLTGLSETSVVHALDAAHVSRKGLVQRHQSQLHRENFKLKQKMTTKPDVLIVENTQMN